MGWVIRPSIGWCWDILPTGRVIGGQRAWFGRSTHGAGDRRSAARSPVRPWVGRDSPGSGYHGRHRRSHDHGCSRTGIPRDSATAEMLAIGAELLIGETRDTNSGDIARELTALGVDVLRM